MNKEVFEKNGDKSLSRRSFLKGMGAAAGAAAMSSSFGFSVMGQEKIKLGCLMALTGGLAKYGPPIADGARFAVKHINEAGGVLGKEVELLVRDTQTKEGAGRDAAAKLADVENVPAIIGALSSGTTVAVSSVTIPKEVVLISPSATAPALTDLDDNDYVYRTCVLDKVQGVIQAKLAAYLEYETVSVIFVDNPYGKGLAEVFKAKFEELGGEVTAMVPYPVELPTYGGEAAKAVDPNPDAINIIGYPAGGNKLLIKTLELGYQGEYLFPDGMKGEGVSPGPTCELDASPEEQYIEGSFGTAPGSPAFGPPKQFRKDYEAEYGPSAVPFWAQCYDATVSVALAMQAAGEASGPAIKTNIRKVANPPGTEVTYGELDKALALAKEGKEINWQGVSGPVTFDENGDMAAGIVEIWAIRDCKVKTVWLVEM